MPPSFPFLLPLCPFFRPSVLLSPLSPSFASYFGPLSTLSPLFCTLTPSSANLRTILLHTKGKSSIRSSKVLKNASVPMIVKPYPSWRIHWQGYDLFLKVDGLLGNWGFFSIRQNRSSVTEDFFNRTKSFFSNWRFFIGKIVPQ